MLLFCQLFGFDGKSMAAVSVPVFPPCDPVTEGLRPSSGSELNSQVCANPSLGLRKRKHRCPSGRAKASYCDEVTQVQRDYFQGISTGKTTDILALLSQEMSKKGDQNNCSFKNEFLVNGRPIL